MPSDPPAGKSQVTYRQLHHAPAGCWQRSLRQLDRTSLRFSAFEARYLPVEERPRHQHGDLVRRSVQASHRMLADGILWFISAGLTKQFSGRAPIDASDALLKPVNPFLAYENRVAA